MWAIPWCSCWGGTPPLSKFVNCAYNWGWIGLHRAVLALWSRTAQGEFGLSLRQGEGVAPDCRTLPATLELALVAAFLALIVGVPMGVYAALKRGTFTSQLFMTISLLGVSLPTFLIGILLILVFR